MKMRVRYIMGIISMFEVSPLGSQETPFPSPLCYSNLQQALQNALCSSAAARLPLLWL